VRSLGSRGRRSPPLAWSGLQVWRHAERFGDALTASGAALLPKPFAPRSLLQSVEDVLGRSSLSQQPTPGGTPGV